MPQIVGWEYVGDDDDGVGADDDIVGAAQGAPKKRALRADNLPQSIVGTPLTTIPASSTGTLIQVPIQRNIRPDRIIFDRVQAASLLVYQISIGTTNLLASGNPIPGDAFAPDAMGAQIRAVETATPSVGLSLVIGNRTASAVTGFCAAIIGPSTKA